MYFFRNFAGYLLNYMGASVRWFFGKVLNFNKNRTEFTFKEYLYGPKKSNDHYDVFGHQFNNRWIGALFFFLITIIIKKILRLY